MSGAVQQWERPIYVASVGKDRCRSLQLDSEGAERMREEIVDLSGNSGAFVERCRSLLFGARPLGLREKSDRLFMSLASVAAIPAD